MSPEEIERLNNKFSHIAMTNRIKDLEGEVRSRDEQIRDLCIESAGNRIVSIENIDCKHRSSVIFDLLAVLFICAILAALTVFDGQGLWLILLAASFYIGYETARRSS